ncbi:MULTISPECIES: TrbI/VirB10 family protein [Sphingomonas]|uniref:TrbI/VirB10 family protein n=1 Tax=Sphingomonas TaxID=13687 RepID=UPI001F07A1F3|nr:MULTISPECIES: TrbI/VirB10 family protein [Sphingomonas]
MKVADTTRILEPQGFRAPPGVRGHAVPYDPRADMDEGALIDASRIAYPAVAVTASRKDNVGLIAGGGVALLLGAATFFGLSSGRDARHAAVAAPPLNQVPTTPALVPPPPRPQLGVLDPSQTPATGSLVFHSPQTFPQVTPIGPAPAAATSLAERLRSPTLLFDNSGQVVTAPGPASGPTEASAPGRIAIRPAGGDEFASRADASAIDTAVARRMVDPASTVSQGTLIPAVLETAINSDLPGYVRAVVSQDVRSFDGSRILIPRSSRLVGQYKSGLAAGQTRAYVLWSRLIRPDGVSVAIASPGTDEAGQSGLAGQVDGHFFKRFGSALLLSVVGAASAIGTGGASLLISGGGASAAGVAAQQNGSIAPTVRVSQGQPIRVFTARDLDFSQVGAPGRL